MSSKQSNNVKCAVCGLGLYRSPSRVKNTKSGVFFCCTDHQNIGYKKDSGISVTPGPKSETIHIKKTFKCRNCNIESFETRKEKTYCSTECRTNYIANLKEKPCNSCREILPVSEFHKAKTTADTYSNHCKNCVLDRWKTWYADDLELKKLKNSVRNKEYSASEKGKDSELRKRLYRYGITLEEYQTLLLRSNGLCEICKVGEAYAIDHDHGSGKVRGLLCSPCNIALGTFKDSKEILSSAIKYLNDFG